MWPNSTIGPVPDAFGFRQERLTSGTLSAMGYGVDRALTNFRTIKMTDHAKNVKSGIDKAAEVAKDAADKTATAAAKAPKNTGEALKDVGQKIKDSGK